MRTKEFLKKNYKYFILAVFLSIFILIAKDVTKKIVFDIDNTIYNFCLSQRSFVLNAFFVSITKFGDAKTLIFIAILCIIFIKNKFYKILIPTNLATIALINYILKHIFLRPRPNTFRLIEETGYSFPSGHAMASTAFYGLLIIYILKNVKNRKLRIGYTFLLSFLIIIIGISRIYVGVHYATDVIAGMCFSILYLTALTKIFDKKINVLEENKTK